MILLDGKKLRDLMTTRLIDEVSDRTKESDCAQPTLAIIQIGNILESNSFISQKKLFAEKIGAKVLHIVHENKVSEDEIIAEIKKLNKDETVHGIILQLPIPIELDKNKIIDAIDPTKDVDGLTATNVKLLCANSQKATISATVLGIISLLKHYDIQIEGKKVVIVGRSMLVGKPLAQAFLNENATVTVCHRHTENLQNETRLADILVVAAGSPHLISKNHVNAGQTIVDVGINIVNQNEKSQNHDHKPENEIPKTKMVGDVNFEEVKNIVSAISPVPGGIGPMTVASLFHNLIQTWKKQLEK